MSRRRHAARAQGSGPRPGRADRYEEMGHLAGFPVVYDTRNDEWIVTIGHERQRFDRPSIRSTTQLMYALFKDAQRRDGNEK